MNLFDQLVNEALKNNQDLSPLRNVVEKELLHHEILRTLSEAGLLSQLTFIGGTCLRTCYGAKRLSEDLDFTGGSDFNRDTLAHMSAVLIDTIQTKYGFTVQVKEPIKETGNVDTWKLKVRTREKNKVLPEQQINIDICAIPSYQKKPSFLINPYRVDMGTNGLIIQAQSLEEIFADKLIAFAFRLNRIKYRDIWDIYWLHTQNVKPAFELIPLKIKDHCREDKEFLKLFEERLHLIKTDPKTMLSFREEMMRFISDPTHQYPFAQDVFWQALVGLIENYYMRM